MYRWIKRNYLYRKWIKQQKTPLVVTVQEYHWQGKLKINGEIFRCIQLDKNGMSRGVYVTPMG